MALCPLLRFTDLEEFVEEVADSPFLQIPHFNPWRIYPDILHVVDLALTMDMHSSTLMIWSDNSLQKFPGRTRDERLRSIFVRYSQWCHACSFLEASSLTCMWSLVHMGSKKILSCFLHLRCTKCFPSTSYLVP